MKAIVQENNMVSGKMVLQACIPFMDLRKKAKFTYRIRPEDNPYDDNVNDYQRQLNLQHVREIENYISSSITDAEKKTIALFPTSMLIAFNLDVDDLPVENDGMVEIELQEGCYIVDGQHRLKAMMDLYDKVSGDIFGSNTKILPFLKNYKFNCSILLNFDLWEQAKVFADVNFTQKKVNKSLYYDIYGYIYEEHATNIKQNAVYLSHALVEHLNVSADSPLYQQIKMLGNGKGTISQSFLVESLLTHIASPRGIWYFDPFGENVNKAMLTFMKHEIFAYLKSIQNVFSEIWKADKTIIRKTTGLGALIRLMGYIHKRYELEPGNKIPESASEIQFEDVFGPYLIKCKQYQNELFSSDKPGRFGGTGGKGLEVSLYKELCHIIETGRASWEENKNSFSVNL